MSDFFNQIRGLSRERLALLASELQQKLEQSEASRCSQMFHELPKATPAFASTGQPHYDPTRSPALQSKYADIVALDTTDPSRLDLLFDECARARLAASRRRTDWGQDVLVLGGNGFVGAHMVHRLLTDKRVRRVRTIIRSRAHASPVERILSSWSKYELPRSSVDMAKLTIIEGSSAVKRFGLSQNEYDALAQEVDSVFDCTGAIDWSSTYLEMRTDWVLGMLGVLQFCLDQSVKQLVYIGSIAARLYQAHEDFARPDSRCGSGYAQVKWVNHAFVQSSARAGMRTVLCEAPHVLGSTTVGKDPGFAYSFWRVIKLAAMLHVTWDGVFPDFSPVDVLVDVIVENGLSADPLPLVRPIAPWRFRTTDLAPLFDCRTVSWGEFMTEIAKYATPAELHMLTDAPEVIEKTIVPPIYPAGYDLRRFPAPGVLAELYLRQLQLAPSQESASEKRSAPALRTDVKSAKETHGSSDETRC